jgi:hypothetical protein
MKVRGTITRIAVISVLSGLIGLLVYAATFGLNASRTTAAATCCAIIGFFGTTIVRISAFVKEKQSGLAADRDSARLDRAAEDLAAAMAGQWQAEERLRRIHDPVPLPVRWTIADPLVSDHWENVTCSDASRQAEELDGSLDEVVDIFERIPSGRLVVIGKPGSGKTVLTLRFTLELLKRREAGDPVPVIFPLHTWHPPSQSLARWMARYLAGAYPALAAIEPSGTTLADKLVDGRRILPVLDGLDEVCAELRANAVQAVNMWLGGDARIVVTCRAAEYSEIVADADVLTSAAVIELAPLSRAELADYLRRTARKTRAGGEGRPATRWDPVLAQLQAEPAAPVSRALLSVLSTPLMASMARAIYSDTPADPAVLLSEQFADSEKLEAHLLSAFVPAAFTGIPRDETGDRQRSWDAQDANRWLSFIARHLDRLDTRDLNWWMLERSLPRSVRSLASGLAAGGGLALVACAMGPVHDKATFVGIGAGTVTGLPLGISLIAESSSAHIFLNPRTYARSVLRRLRFASIAAVISGTILALVIGSGLVAPDLSQGSLPIWATFVIGCLFGLSGGVMLGTAGIARQPAPTAHPLRLGRKNGGFPRICFALSHGLICGLAAGFIFALAFGIAAAGAGAVRDGEDFGHLLRFWLHAGITDGLYAGIIGGLFLCFDIPADVTRAASPRSTWNSDRDASLIRSIAVALICAVIMFFVFAYPKESSSGRFSMSVIAEILATCIIIGILVASLNSWSRFQVARCWLAARGVLPWRVISFLEDAHRNGVLRQTGASYQFRHFRLQERLLNTEGPAGRGPDKDGTPTLAEAQDYLS